METGLGIDLGSAEVRVGAYEFNTNQLVAVESRQVKYYDHGNKKVTQSSKDIIDAILECIEKLPIDISHVRSCGVAATCSLALFHAAAIEGLVPYKLYDIDTEPAQNVVFWMDGTAVGETEELNCLCGIEKDFLGGGFIPEMGAPKLLAFLRALPSHNPGEYEVYDLHTYIAYELALRFKWESTLLINRPNKNGIGHDGEVRGWNPDFYESAIKLPNNVKIGPTRINRMFSPVKVASCIDCYAGWFAMCSSEPNKSLFMAAGTSTCYLYAKSKDAGCIPGIWGPFTDILSEGDNHEWSVYEAGQSTTGKLIEHLFESHPAARQHASNRNSLFAHIESVIEEIEQVTKQSIHFSARYLFTYGELQGNRTPYCDPNMTGMFIGESADISFQDLVYKYVTILEFLAFQTRQIRDCLEADIRDITISGSQAKNSRLLSLISLVNGNIPVKRSTVRAELMGVKGAFFMGKSRSLNESLSSVAKTHIEDSSMSYVEIISSLRDNNKICRLLEAKYEVYLDMARTQRKYRSIVDTHLK
ncbi:LAME_0G02828g1_1 [Lachancea meyersii CBS 8951]|uniref:LAME_0G02828g1_1 n=1 Tax=Lachancea meyersii CBS 8951 TaxID=1266667 RepID=A0A1G4K687_9SACH|nr:LAME_0G02828g1_1 [Lachancea meyersii CBS 8951]